MTDYFQFREYFNELFDKGFIYKQNAGVITDESGHFINLKIHYNYLSIWNEEGSNEIRQIMTIMVSRSFLWNLCLRFKTIEFQQFQHYLVRYLREVKQIHEPIVVYLNSQNTFQTIIAKRSIDIFSGVLENDETRLKPLNIKQKKVLTVSDDQIKQANSNLEIEIHQRQFQEILKTGVLDKDSKTISFGRRNAIILGIKGNLFNSGEISQFEPIEIVLNKINRHEFAIQNSLDQTKFYQTAIARFLHDDLGLHKNLDIIFY
jgi:hypothetical protein